MVTKKYLFGNVVIEIQSPISMLEDSRFEEFLTDKNAKSDFTYEILPPKAKMFISDDEPILIERTKNHLFAYMDISLLKGITVANFFSGAKTANLLPERGACILHCSYVRYKEAAILFCAPCGTGKSTQAKYWESIKPVEIVNEDRAIISKKDNRYFAHGCWATGSSKICKNISAPIQCIVLLEQGTENKVHKLSASEMISKIVPQCTFDEQNILERNRMIFLVADLLKEVKVFGYSCVNDVSAVTELEKYL